MIVAAVLRLLLVGGLLVVVALVWAIFSDRPRRPIP